jgi:ATP phosphoribosyltransferase
VARQQDAPDVPPTRRLRVATKYPAITRAHFARKGQQVEIIKLYGSMELAPLVGLADLIVDLVDTGRTLKANGLIETEIITQITARIVVNKAAMKMKHELIEHWLEKFRQAGAGA